MPTYDYRCGACGHEFELFQPMKDGPKRKCPKCGKNALQRLIGTGAAVLFKGGGFYETDYRSESYKKSAEAEKKAKEPAASESKPEPKASDGKSADSKTADGKGAPSGGGGEKAPATSKAKQESPAKEGPRKKPGKGSKDS